MKNYLLLIIGLIIMMSCKKQDPTDPSTPAPSPTTTSTLHPFELKWITTASALERSYQSPSGGLLTNKWDTVYQGTTSIKYQYEEGIPNKYVHSLSGYSYVSNADSVEVQIWIDGVLKAKKKDQMYASVNYQY